MNNPIHGRGASLNPTNRFDKIDIKRDEEYDPSEDASLQTEFFKDTSKSLISFSDSPDMGHMASMNPYRGCEHGCIYCYARPFHEYLGLSSGLDFESKIFVKEDAPKILYKELSSPRWKPQVIMSSGVTDCYQPAERHFRLTRACLEVLADFRNPVSIITKNKLVTRDIDVFLQLNEFHCVAVTLSLTTLNPKIGQKMEPRAAQPMDRLKAVETLKKAGIPVGVNLAPIVPGLTDEEIPFLIKAAVEAGAQWAGLIPVRLPYQVKDLFVKWLEDHFPERKEKVLNRLKSMHKGKLYDSNWETRHTGEGIFAENIQMLFKAACQKFKLPQSSRDLTTEHFRIVDRNQLMLEF